MCRPGPCALFCSRKNLTRKDDEPWIFNVPKRKSSVLCKPTTDDIGRPLIPAVRSAHFADGPAGRRQNQIMEQIAQGATLRWLLYHHPPHAAECRGPALHPGSGTTAGTRSVTEYTMSGSSPASTRPWSAPPRKTVSCSSTDQLRQRDAGPTMLQFLQCKTFGNQAVPEGWVIVAAGNPPVQQECAGV